MWLRSSLDTDMGVGQEGRRGSGDRGGLGSGVRGMAVASGQIRSEARERECDGKPCHSFLSGVRAERLGERLSRSQSGDFWRSACRTASCTSGGTLPAWADRRQSASVLAKGVASRLAARALGHVTLHRCALIRPDLALEILRENGDEVRASGQRRRLGRDEQGS